MKRFAKDSASKTKRAVPRDYFSRREQYRLLVLVAVLFGVLWAMNEARNPANWYWLTGPPESSELEWSERVAQNDAPAEPIDTRLHDTGPSGDALPADVFRAPVERDPVDSLLGDDYFPGVRRDYLETIEDDRPLNRGSEYHAFYHLLALLRETPQQELDDASLGEVGFVQLYQQTQEYRARVVTIKGTLRRAEYQTVSLENEYGIEGYYIGWMEPAGGPRELISVMFLQSPEGMPLGESIAAEVTFTGFFYKRFPYQAVDARRSAPLVLAKEPQWTPPAPLRPPPAWKPLQFGIAVGVTALAAIAFSVAAWYYSQHRSPQAEKLSLTGRVRKEDVHRPDDEQLLPSPAEALAQLSELEQQTPSEGAPAEEDRS